MLPIRFTNQQSLPVDASYETFIFETGQVPTRDNFHDFFNALMWLTFPRIKRQLNALQAAAINAGGIQSSRGGLRDAATLFDENAAIVVVNDAPLSEELLSALYNHEWEQCFLNNREQFSRHIDVWVFGHALLEKLIKPYKSITAHAWVVHASNNYTDLSDGQRRTWLDEQVSQRLQDLGAENFHPRLFTPLPILGIPGWWSEQNTEFYADRTVFRRKRSSSASQ